MAKKKAFLLRLDPSVHRALQKWAEDEFRSLNGHLEYLLRRALIKEGRPKRPEDEGEDAGGSSS